MGMSDIVMLYWICISTVTRRVIVGQRPPHYLSMVPHSSNPLNNHKIDSDLMV